MLLSEMLSGRHAARTSPLPTHESNRTSNNKNDSNVPQTWYSYSIRVLNSTYTRNKMKIWRQYKFWGMFFFLMVAMYGYYWIVDGHGTFLPPVAWYYTTRYPGFPNGNPSTPPKNWNGDGTRVVISLTTIPIHISKLRDTLQSLSEQTYKADVIYINLPKYNPRLKQRYPDPPEWLEKDFQHANVKVNSLDNDFGPATKLVGTLIVEHDPDTIIITVDDDKVYHPDLVRNLVWHSVNDPQSAFGPCGFSFLPMPMPRGVAPVYVPWWQRKPHGHYTDELQATCGNTYRRGFFPDLELIKYPPSECFTTDDLWIAGYLATKARVPRVLIPGPLINTFDSADPPWKEEEGKSKDVSSRLSFTNSKPGKDIGCIKAVEAMFGPWPRVRDYDIRSL